MRKPDVKAIDRNRIVCWNSQSVRFATYILHSKRLILAALMVAGIVAFISTQPGIAPAGPVALIVNSTNNTSDGACDVTNCTLREAIDDSNAGMGDTIMFNPDVFQLATPTGLIDIESGLGPLPPITADIAIDASNARVIIDGNGNNDALAVGPGLAVHGSHTGFTFALLGDSNFTIQDITGRGINVSGQGFSMFAITIDAVTITGTTDDGIFVAGTPYVSSLIVTSSTIESGDVGIGAVMSGPNIPDISYFLSDNDIGAANADGAGGAAVALNLQTGLAANSTADVEIIGNRRLHSDGDVGVNLTYCSAGTPCALNQSQINASISENDEVSADGDAIRARLNADPAAPGSADSTISLHINDNAGITASSDALDIVSHLCCGSNNQQIITVDGNGPISTLPAGSDAVDIEAGACCSPGSGVAIDVSDNSSISANEGNALQLLLGCCGDNSVDIHDNGAITSANDNGVQILNCVEDEANPQQDEADCIADSTTLLNITGNTLSGSAEDGIHICCGQFQLGTERSVISGNTITANERDGIEIDSSHGINIGPGNIITGNGASGDLDNNGVEIENFVSALIYSLYAVDVPANGTTVTQNEIHGNGGLGIDLVGFSPLGDPQNPGEPDFEYALVGCTPYPAAPVNANDCLASPVLSGVASEKLAGQTCAGCQIEVFLADDQPPDQPAAPENQHGEGATFLAAATATGAGGFSIALTCNLSAGQLTATATGPGGSTSEFSANLAFSATGSGGGGCTLGTATPTQTSGPTPATATPAATTTAPPPITPSSTPAHTATPTAVSALCGDVDASGSVNSVDAANVLQYSAGLLQTLVEPQGADVNNDGDINSIDAALILQHTAGLLPALTC